MNANLSLGVSDIRDQIADFLGYGPSYSDLSTAEQNAVDIVRRRGERQFYYPEPMREGMSVHQWSFMRPMFTFDTTEDEWQYLLPPQFGGIEGDITFTNQDQIYPPIRSVLEEKIRRQRAISESTGKPVWYAIVSLEHEAAKEQRQQLWLYPTPDDAYPVEFRMIVNPFSMETNGPWPYGGTAHAETILASCLAIAELSRDGKIGEQREYYMRRLAVSVSIDSQNSEPEILGYNGDGSVGPVGRYDRSQGVDVTYNGVLY